MYYLARGIVVLMVVQACMAFIGIFVWEALVHPYKTWVVSPQNESAEMDRPRQLNQTVNNIYNHILGHQFNHFDEAPARKRS